MTPITGNQADDGWIMHDGSGLPVHSEHKVIVLFRNGKTSIPCWPKFFCAGHDWWKHDGPQDRNIIAFRIAEDEDRAGHRGALTPARLATMREAAK